MIQLLLYCFTVFIGSYLLFQVQLIIGKYLLPWFGGVSSVWTTCMLFFQAFLLLGYGWSHLLVSRARLKKQLVFQAILVLSSLCFVSLQFALWGTPTLPDQGLVSGMYTHPSLSILVLLLLSIGLPFLTLATTSTLLQSWYYATENKTPYWLYAVSNAGSLTGLLSYPFFIERIAVIESQAGYWVAGYMVYAIASVLIMLMILKKLLPASGDRVARSSDIMAPSAHRSGKDGLHTGNERSGKKTAVTLKEQVLWIFLAATASTALLAFTNQVTQEVAVVPFLWVVPLSMYLITFIFSFSAITVYRRDVYGVLLGVLSLLVVYVLIEARTVPVTLQLLLFLCTLFVICMICHGEISRRKPAPEYLTRYFLLIAIGGAIGGLFASLIAPAVFNGYWELHLSVLACAGALMYLVRESARSTLADKESRNKVAVGFYLPVVLLAIVLSIHPVRYYRDSIYAQRNFYGVIRVEKKHVMNPRSDVHFLMHGITTHGFQFIDKQYRSMPTCYYGEQSGVGLALEMHPLRLSGNTLQVGAVGLGIGTVAAYGRAGDGFDFIEINPAVTSLAEGMRGYFSYLENTEAKYRTLAGDGRRVLEQMQKGSIPLEDKYDVLILDAFSSDAVPVHLLTAEAFDLYLDVVKRDGIVAFHTSNRTLAVSWEVIRQAMHKEIPSAVIITDGGTYTFGSEWVLVTRNESFLAIPEVSENLVPYEAFGRQYDVHLWTDRFSNLFEIIK